MHGFGREFDVSSPQKGIVTLGYFKDGEPFVGRFKKFEMDEVRPVFKNPVRKMVIEKELMQQDVDRPTHPNDIELSLRGSVVQDDNQQDENK